ncbi:MAG TPA: hypothetical protein VGG04_09020 [Candidatus Sulfotelmatobacter sp.]|jgi:hypothetical protein
MATDSTHLTARASVSEVVKMVVIEHRELRVQYREVTTRIRNLRIAVRTLRSLGGKDAQKPETKVSTDSELPTAESATEASPQLPDHSGEPRGESALRRAIRIAVLETPDVVSDNEIYLRIVRRGSFSFPDYESAAPAIEKELENMTEQGELRRVESATKSGWQRSESSPASSGGI